MKGRAALYWLALLALCTVAAVALFQVLAGRTLGIDLAGIRYELRQPRMLGLLSVVPLVAWGAMRSLADLPALQRLLLLVTRSTLIALLALALARPVRVGESTQVSAVVLLDVSDSLADDSLQEARSIAQEIWRMRGDNDVQLVSFASRPRRLSVAADAQALPELERHQGEGAGSATDLQAAVQLAYGLFPPGHLPRLVLISDGAQTRGDLLREATRARRFRLPIFYHPLLKARPREVAVTGLDLPERIEVGKPFRLAAQLFATAAARVTVRLYQDEALNGLDAVRHLEIVPGKTAVEFESVVRIPGEVRYRLQIESAGADRFSSNNVYATTVSVPGRARVLYVEGDSRGTGHLQRALEAAGYAVEVRTPRGIPRDQPDLDQYDFFILSDVNAEHLSAQQMLLIERYLRDRGGGFLMAGGENGFGLGGYRGTRLERLLPVRLQTSQKRQEHSLAMALVMDRSGSMTGQKMELSKQAARATAGLLRADDWIEVVGFSGTPERVVRMQSARNRAKIENDIGRLKAQGGTAILPALDLAFQDLIAVTARIKHVILLTDGRTQETGLEELARAMRLEGITLSTVGLGRDVNRTLLADTARQGGGRAYFTVDPHSVPRIFVSETRMVTRSGSVEEPFYPRVAERADFLRGIALGTAPLLHGYVATEARGRPAQLILASETGEPILARWHVGLGWSLAWTSDVKSRWAAEWLRWGGFSKFWGQLVREHMRRKRGDVLPMRAELYGDRVRAVVNAVGEDDRFLNDLESTLVLKAPEASADDASSAGKVEQYDLQQTAPGRYEVDFPLHRYGSFVLRAIHRRGGREVATSTAHLTNPYPTEYARLQPDVKLLEQTAILTRAERLQSPERIFDPGKETVRHYRERWGQVLLFAIALFLLDLALRRVHLFDRSFSPVREKIPVDRRPHSLRKLGIERFVRKRS